MQSGIRKIKKMAKAKPTLEGAGVHLHRAFGFQGTDSYDPFLLLDDFRGDNPEDYLAGFPRHPHRGIETITYMLAVRVEHGDSLGNSGVIGAGGVQWMTAGSGIGINPVYADMHIPPGVSLTLPTAADRNAFAYVYEGSVCFSDERDPFSHPTEAERWHDTHPPAEAVNRTLVLFDHGEQLTINSGDQGARFLLVSGTPLKEPVTWYGPIVMNTREQLKQAFTELEEGTFLRHSTAVSG